MSSKKINLRDVFNLLKSTKATERQEGVQGIRNAFAQDKVVANFCLKKDGTTEPKQWLPVFQALFSTVLMEKDGMKKASSRTSSARRISEASSTIRWLTERSSPFMNKSVVAALFQHFTQMLSSPEEPLELFQPIALDYAKSIKALLTYTPHINSLDDSHWVKIVEISFNVILGDPIKAPFSRDDLMSEPATPSVNADDDMYSDEELAEEEEPGFSNIATPKGKKRLRRDPTPKPILPRNKRKEKRHVHTTVTAEQIEFASILSIALASPVSPILSDNFPHLPTSIMTRLRQFLELYPMDSSLLYDYINILSSVLDHLSLNRKHDVEVFARSTWSGLIGLWGTKDRHLKETLVIILRKLFQFVICPTYPDEPKLPPFDAVNGIGELCKVLDAEAEHRRGTDGLALDAIRLDISKPGIEQSGEADAFVTQTFRAGWNFDAEQALSWAILELRADCAGKLFQLSESMQHPTPITGSSRSNSKRIRLENPVTFLLQSIQTVAAAQVRNYHLQTLLFFIDRHWNLVHDSLKQDVIDVLLQYVAVEDSAVQSWVFLNFAAIAVAEGSREPRKPTGEPSSLNTAMWDSIWAHAIRRANAPIICRAACHAGQALLTAFYSVSPKPNEVQLTPARVLLDIETFTKDMDVQGPSYPFDSVCIFLSHCLAIASQDARLYRLHLEDTVLSWFVDSWKLSRIRSKMVAYATKDILKLLGTICGLSKCVEFTYRPLLPNSEIVESMVQENKTKIIRDFLLYARVPSLSHLPRASQVSSASAKGLDTSLSITSGPEKILVMARGRERRISAFFHKTLESLVAEWDSSREAGTYVTAEMARQTLDISLSAVAFESLFHLNGITPNRQVLQNSSKVITFLAQSINDSNWNTTERLLVIQGLELFLPEGEITHDDTFHRALSQPGLDSGIKQQTLKHILSAFKSDQQRQSADRLSFLRLVWQNPEIQDSLGIVARILREVLDETLTGSSSHYKTNAMDVDDKDGFGPIRTVNVQTPTPNMSKSDNNRSTQHTVEVCIGVLASGPFLQSLSSRPTRDKELVQSILNSADNRPEMFSLVCPVFFSRVRQCMFTLPIKHMNAFLDQFSYLLPTYIHGRDERLHCVLLDFLSSCLGFWKSEDSTIEEVHNKFMELCDWLAASLTKEHMRSWALRDSFIRFMDNFLAEDPTQEAWASKDQAEDEDDAKYQKRLERRQKRLPTTLLPTLNADADIRVRFRAAFVNARLYSLLDHLQDTPMNMYDNMRQYYTKDINNYEHMLSRILSLGNIMIVSSAVRRGPYWHLLEACIYTQQYVAHTEAILIAVSERLGLPSLSIMFVAYASQIAYSMRIAEVDIITFPPHLLGYRDRRQSSEAGFRLFTPTNLLNQGRTQFEGHCKMLQKSVTDGLRDCFGETVGLAIAMQLAQSSGEDLDGLESYLKEIVAPLDNFWSIFEQNLDQIVASTLQCLGQQDFSDGGPIMVDLRAFDQQNNTRTASIFKHLSTYRSSDPSKPHQPNLPDFPAETILNSLQWISTRLPDAFTKATTYHVLHLLMDKIHKTPLVNEQHRLINAITLWMAYRRQDLEELTILNSIIHGATSLLCQSDLTCAAQSILEVALWYYQRLKFNTDSGCLGDSHLPNFLVRICCIAQDFASVVNDRSLSELGSKLLTWIDQQAYMLSTNPIFKSVITRALAAWPHQPSSELLALYNEIMLSDLTSILDDPHVSSNKFRLVRRIRDQVLMGDDKEGHYSKTYFWRLKEYMPPPDRLQDEDIEAFTELLSSNHGIISGFNPEPVDLDAPRTRQRRMFRKPNMTEDALALEPIVLGLLMMLKDDDPTRVSNAYHTLRLVMTTSSSREFRFTPSEYRIEVDYLKHYKPLPIFRPVPNIQEVLLSDTFSESTNDFQRWVSLLTVLFSDILAVFDPFFGQLSSILTSDSNFAEQILPNLVYTLLSLKQTNKLDHIPGSLKEILSVYFTSILSSKDADITCVRAIVDIVLHLRYFNTKSNDALTYNKWLDINFTLLAQSAARYGAYTTALLFTEIAADQEGVVSDGHITEQVLYEIYAHIDEPDGFYGIKTSDLHQFLIKRLHHEKEWDKAFRFHGAALEAGNSGKVEEEGLLESFHHFGFDRLAMDTLRNLPGESPANLSTSASINYELAWRTETWDLPDQASDPASSALYRSLKVIHRERDLQLVDNTVRSAFLAEMSYLKSLGSENLAEIRAVSQDLMCLGQILQWRDETIQGHLKVEDMSLETWKAFIDPGPDFEFSALESFMATRISLIRSIRQREERQQIGTSKSSFLKGLIDVEKHCLLRLSEAARTSDQVQIALNSVVRAQQLDSQPSAAVSEEFAHVLWVQKEEKLAVQFLQHLIDSSDDPDGNAENRTRRAMWLSRLGTWISDACLKKPAEIWVRYFDPAISLLDQVKEGPTRVNCLHAKIYRECAMFSERQYHSTLKSQDALRWKVYVERKTQEIEQRQKELNSISDRTSQQYKDLAGEKYKAVKLLDEDSEHFKKHNTLRDTSLRQAIDMYSRCLESSDTFDSDSAIRLCSLWLANFDDKSTLDYVKVALDRIPSRKFAFLAHQLTARLATTRSGSVPQPQDNLQRLVLRMCQEHPFHILYQVYCLGDHASTTTGSSRRQSATQASQSTQTERGTAANSIFERLRVDDATGERVRNVERLCDAYLQWAQYRIRNNDNFKIKSKKIPFKIPSGLKILKISDLHVPVSTARTPLDPTMQYKDCVWIHRYEPTFDTAGGINLPKINICIGSDGRRYKQLFKGEGQDDMRQDAVMEQVFDLVNGVLKRDRETRRRQLNVRDYKVIPLASQAGLLEFVGNTSPLRDWLMKAHPLYHPQDMKPNDMFSALDNRKKGLRPEQQLELFLRIRPRFKPVMRHYFTEKHKNPINWFQMRLCYSRSVATTSIVGHILGLGDRHSSNILIDNVSGEVVHIDLGIAFDQGKLLAVPERVPFRMTGDMIDGMGPSGTAGVFQRCAEETLRVLREESEVIMTVLEVFKHDPLHSWTASEFKVKQAQSKAPTVVSTTHDANRLNLGIGIDMTSGSADEAADRALSSVARKLDKSLSVESTVNELLAEATDPMNLATMYAGWGPYF